MRTIAHISDLHFGKIQKEAEEDLLQDLCAIRPSVIAISGDLTQRANRKEFKRARQYLEKLPAPFIVVPGNHDIPMFDITRRFFLPLHRYKNYISKNLNPLYLDNEVALVGMNSARSFTLVNGKINKKQMKNVQTILQNLPEVPFRIAVTHHPLCKHPKLKRREIMKGARKTLEKFAELQVDIILTGHYHLSHTMDVQSVHTDLTRSILHIQAGTAISKRVRHEANAYNFLTIEKNILTVDIRTWTGKHFEVTDSIRYRRTARGWQKIS